MAKTTAKKRTSPPATAQKNQRASVKKASMVVDGSGNLYATLEQSTYDGNCDVSNVGQAVMKRSPSGSLLWLRTATVGALYGITVSNTGNVYVVGSQGMARYSNTSNLVWAKKGTSRPHRSRRFGDNCDPAELWSVRWVSVSAQRASTSRSRAASVANRHSSSSARVATLRVRVIRLEAGCLTSSAMKLLPHPIIKQGINRCKLESGALEKPHV
jgi:hypothetical protein